MQPHKFIIGILMVSVFVTAGLFVMFGTESDSSDGLFENYEDVSVRVNEINRSKFSSMDSEQGGESTAEAIYNITKTQEDDLNEEIDKTTQWRVVDIGPIKAIRRMKSYYNLLNVMIEDIAKILHIPQFFVDFAVISFSTIVIFMVAYFIIRFQPRND